MSARTTCARILSFATLVAVAALGAPAAGQPPSESYPLEPEPTPVGPWSILLGLDLGGSDYASRGVGFENRWALGVSLGATYRLGASTDLGVELGGRFLGMEEPEPVGAEPPSIVSWGAVYAFTPALRIARRVAFGEGPLALALLGRLGVTTEVYAPPEVQARNASGEIVLVVAGPRTRSAPTLALALGLDFPFGRRNDARLEAGYALAYFPREGGESLIRTPAGARHEATLRFSILYGVPRRGG